MKNRLRVLAGTLVALSLLSCASGPTFHEMSASLAGRESGMGRIYFYRTTVIGAAVQPEVRLNGEAVGKAVPQGFFYVDRPPGNYQVSTTTEVERDLTFTLEEGQTRYVRLSISMGLFVGHVYGELVDESEGKSEIVDTHFIGTSAGEV